MEQESFPIPSHEGKDMAGHKEVKVDSACTSIWDRHSALAPKRLWSIDVVIISLISVIKGDERPPRDSSITDSDVSHARSSLPRLALPSAIMLMTKNHRFPLSWCVVKPKVDYFYR